MIRILVADADPAARRALSLLLRRKMGINDLFEVGDVEALIRALVDTPPEVLLLDWKLYGTPPLETCRLLQKAFPHLKIVLLSLDAGDELIARSTGVDFMHKAAAPEPILAKLTSILYQDSLCLSSTE
jgi:two-component system, NarL family, nitrate/nitrite response regulator NarL